MTASMRGLRDSSGRKTLFPALVRCALSPLLIASAHGPLGRGRAARATATLPEPARAANSGGCPRGL